MPLKEGTPSPGDEVKADLFLEVTDAPSRHGILF